MESNDRLNSDVLAERKYIVRRKEEEVEISFSIAAPYDIQPAGFLHKGAACKVFLSPECKEGREVQGRDKMEAICHALLMIEARLILLSQQGELFHEDGTRAVIDDFGLFFGLIGKPYREKWADML